MKNMRPAFWLLFLLTLQAQQPLCFVEGRIVNAENGEPVRRAKILLGRTDNPGAGNPTTYMTYSDARGKFAMQGIDPGKYSFSAEHAGFATAEYGARRPGRNGITLSLDSGQRLGGVLFRMIPHAVITGRILDQDGEPMEGVQVQATRYQYSQGKRQLRPSKGAATDDLGEYRIFGLAPGRYFLEATYRQHMWQMMGRAVRSGSGKQAEEGYVPTYYPGTIDPSTATAIELSPGTQLRGMDFALSKTHTVSVRGQVTHSGTAGQRFLMVTLAPKGQFQWDSIYRTRTQNPEGKFEFANVRPGSYTLAATLFAGGENYSASQALDVTTAVDNVALNLAPGAPLSGQVRFEGNASTSVKEIQVCLNNREPGEVMFGPIPCAEPKDDGSFTVSNVGTDTYTVNVNNLSSGFYVKSVRVGDDEFKESGIDTTHGVTGPLLITVSDKAGQIEGVVLSAKQQAVGGATVVLVPEPKFRERPGKYKAIATDQYGRFLLKTIEPGEYKLFAWEDIEPGEYMDPEVLKPVEEGGHPVSIREGSRESAELKLIPAERPVTLPKPRK
ncbi:MAG: carboxypeptidase regulatory-like domain-containing protein [Bryobacteraceae bacterium]